MNAQRWKELLAISMIGEGMLAAFFPEQHMRLWHVGPGPLQSLVQFCERRPRMTRALASLEAAFGLWLATRQFAEPTAKKKLSSQVRRFSRAVLSY